MFDPTRWEWLDRYFSGDCTSQEAQEIEQWIDVMPERRRRIEVLREIWIRAAGRPDARWDAATAWQRLMPTLEIPIKNGSSRPTLVTPEFTGGKATPTHRRTVHAWRAAAVLVIGVAAAGWLLMTGRRATQHEIAGLREYVAPRGQRVNFLLTDGTSIVLAPGSALQTASRMSRTGRRDVYLRGEALFQVVHSADRPFVVHTVRGTAEDLGTRFTVAAYPSDTAMRVVVAEGAVAVHGAGDSTATRWDVRAGDLAIVGPTGRTVVRHDVAVTDYLSWTTGQLIFRDTSVPDVIAVLARWYDVDIRIAPAAMSNARRRRVTLITEPDQPLASVLTALTVPAGLHARWVDSSLIVVGP